MKFGLTFLKDVDVNHFPVCMIWQMLVIVSDPNPDFLYISVCNHSFSITVIQTVSLLC